MQKKGTNVNLITTTTCHYLVLFPGLPHSSITASFPVLHHSPIPSPPSRPHSQSSITASFPVLHHSLIPSPPSRPHSQSSTAILVCSTSSTFPTADNNGCGVTTQNGTTCSIYRHWILHCGAEDSMTVYEQSMNHMASWLDYYVLVHKHL